MKMTINALPLLAAVILALLLPLRPCAASGGVSSLSRGPDPYVVVRIPTGSEEGATKIMEELERVGLGTKFDHIRTLAEVEAVFQPVELERLTNHHSTPLDLRKFPHPSEWTVVRNLTKQEPGIARPADQPASFYIPIIKKRYHTPSDVEHILRAFTREYPNLASIRRVSESEQGAVVWALILSTTQAPEPEDQDNVEDEAAKQARERYFRTHTRRSELSGFKKPAILMTGSLHGNDRVGQELCLWVIEYLCRSYSRVTVIRRLMDETDLVFIPTINPDATSINQRYTRRGVDLDRAFRDRVRHGTNPVLPEREVQGLTEWFLQQRFMVSMSFLGGGGGPAGGGLVVRYPWSSSPYGLIHRPDRTPDDRGFRYLARTYASAHPIMIKDDPRGRSPDAGTVNGAAWYTRYGSMQDWLYHNTATMHLDIVLSPYLAPLPQHLPVYWDENYRSILDTLRNVHGMGLRGTLVDAETGGAIPESSIVIHDLYDRRHKLSDVVPDQETGFFARFLAPGRYAIYAAAPGYKTSDEHLFELNHARKKYTLTLELSAA